MVISKVVKENPIKIIFGSAGGIIAIIGALFTIDGRYAHAEDFKQSKIETQQIIIETTSTLRKQMLEDKLFELDVKKAQARNLQLAPLDQALYIRYQRQLSELNEQSPRSLQPRSLSSDIDKSVLDEQKRALKPAK
jgi:hypothetical protein